MHAPYARRNDGSRALSVLLLEQSSLAMTVAMIMMTITMNQSLAAHVQGRGKRTLGREDFPG